MQGHISGLLLSWLSAVSCSKQILQPNITNAALALTACDTTKNHSSSSLCARSLEEAAAAAAGMLKGYGVHVLLVACKTCKQLKQTPHLQVPITLSLSEAELQDSDRCEQQDAWPAAGMSTATSVAAGR
jgi:hypothetical protein